MAQLVDSNEGDVAQFLDPEDLQRALKLGSRRAARELMVREMQHVVVGRTPMTTADWLAEWLQSTRRSPRGLMRTEGPRDAWADGRARAARGSNQAIPPARRTAKRAGTIPGAP